MLVALCHFLPMFASTRNTRASSPERHTNKRKLERRCFCTRAKTAEIGDFWTHHHRSGEHHSRPSAPQTLTVTQPPSPSQLLDSVYKLQSRACETHQSPPNGVQGAVQSRMQLGAQQPLRHAKRDEARFGGGLPAPHGKKHVAIKVC